MNPNWSRMVNRYADDVLPESFERPELRVRRFFM
jgi:hypothetical protein